MTHSTDYHFQTAEEPTDVLALLRMLQFVELQLAEHDPLTRQIVAMAVQSLTDHCEMHGRSHQQH